MKWQADAGVSLDEERVNRMAQDALNEARRNGGGESFVHSGRTFVIALEHLDGFEVLDCVVMRRAVVR